MYIGVIQVGVILLDEVVMDFGVVLGKVLYSISFGVL